MVRFTRMTGLAAVAFLALGAMACSPAAGVNESTVASSDESVPEAQPAEATIPPALAAIITAPETAAPQTDGAQNGSTQGASMQGGSDQAANQSTNQDVRDARLVGVWANEKQINSPGGAGGFASLSTVMTMEIHADGSILQYTQSVGGGGDWSSNSGKKLDFEGKWRADGATMSVFGMGLADYTPAATYSFSGQYLVTNNDQGRLIWQKR